MTLPPPPPCSRARRARTASSCALTSRCLQSNAGSLSLLPCSRRCSRCRCSSASFARHALSSCSLRSAASALSLARCSRANTSSAFFCRSTRSRSAMRRASWDGTRRGWSRSRLGGRCCGCGGCVAASMSTPIDSACLISCCCPNAFSSVELRMWSNVPWPNCDERYAAIRFRRNGSWRIASIAGRLPGVACRSDLTRACMFWL
mmetsp:Transcript_58658/g.127583  ORF Transcript_58658/g.127583 Transcript_58658/m.127583 type:complete len:204 (-) Transcript_58658:716-1327(-)